MNKLALGLAVVAIVIAGLAYVHTGSKNTAFGSATNCTDGYTCLTNLEVQGSLITDATTTATGALNLNASALCVNFYATSTATRLKLVASTTATLPNGAAAVLVAQYGLCTSS